MSLSELAHVFLEWPEWRERAACAGIDPTGEIFHPRRGEVSDTAANICGGCPVSIDCLEYALVNVIRVGIWGGTSERWRRRERHQRMRERMGLERLPDVADDPRIPDWVPAEQRSLWKRKRAPRRATFGAGTKESMAWARKLTLALDAQVG